MSVQVEIDFKQVNRFMESFSAAHLGAKKHNLLDGLGALVLSQTQERIDTEKISPSGKAWLENKRKNPTLHDSGSLRDSLSYVVGLGEVSVGSNLVYAAIHQYGGRAGRGAGFEMPVRPYIGLSRQNKREIEDELNDWMQGVFNVGK